MKFDLSVDEFSALFGKPAAEGQGTLLALNEKVDKIMATVQDVKTTIAAEKAEVKAKLDGLTAEIQALKDQVAQGQAVTPQQLDELIVAVKDIFTPEAGTVTPGTVDPIP